MDLHEKTKYKFAEAIKSLMQYHELDKITVTDIVKVESDDKTNVLSIF